MDEADFRANLAHGETRSLGAAHAFPEKCVHCVLCFVCFVVKGGGGVVGGRQAL